jgi:ammonium transporter, Amt family
MTQRRPRGAYVPLLFGLSWIWLLAVSMPACADDRAAPVVNAADAPRSAALPAGAQPVDTIFMMAASALTLLMVPALGLFYGGMVRRKNVLATFQQSFILLGVIAVQWVVVGYSLAFGPDAFHGLCGTWRWVLLSGVGIEPDADLAAGVPHQLFMVFQMMVAALSAALISGAIAERARFLVYVLFVLLWTTLVYDPVAHWVWSSDGWIHKQGGLDFAGGLVVQLTSGLAALMCAMVIGKRKGLDTEDMNPHNLTLTALGTALLWFGWLGLSCGGARGANAGAVAAFVATSLAGAGAVVSWSALEYLQKRKVTMLGTCTGAIAGLVIVSPAAGYVTPVGALALGALVCPLCYGAILLKARLGYDDALDVFGVHGIGGIAGTLALGVLATPALTGKNGGLLDGNADLLFAQVFAVLGVTVYTVAVTGGILLVIDRAFGFRVTTDEEELGLDLTQHGQRGYIMEEEELIGMARK